MLQLLLGKTQPPSQALIAHPPQITLSPHFRHYNAIEITSLTLFQLHDWQ
jgi:hypothetical protein